MVALDTFKNLAGGRQQEIILVALREFALNEYKTASLSTIIESLGLAKGSFYRYFKSKQSLYFYLLDTCIKTRIESDKKFITHPSKDFFELLVQHFVAKINFDKAFPLHSAFLHNVIQERNNDDLGDIQSKSRRVAVKIIKDVLLTHLKKGAIRKDIDIDTLAFFVFKNQISITEFLGSKHKIDFNKKIRQGKPLYDIKKKEILAVSRDFAELLKNGIKPKPH